MVYNARFNRSLGEERDKNELIEISKEINEKLSNLPSQKSRAF